MTPASLMDHNTKFEIHKASYITLCPFDKYKLTFQLFLTFVYMLQLSNVASDSLQWWYVLQPSSINNKSCSISGHLQHSFAFTCIEYVTQWSHMGKCEIMGKTVPVLVDLHAAL